MKNFKKIAKNLFLLLLMATVFMGCVSVESTSYSVTFDSQNGTDLVTVEVEDGAAVGSSLPNIPVNTGFVFGGWYTMVDGGEELIASTVVIADITVYAKWLAEFTVTYIDNGKTSGTVPIDGIIYTNDQVVTIFENTGFLLKINVDGDSYKFMGWTNSSGIVSGSVVMGTTNIVLYAKWSSYELRDVGLAGGLIFYDAGNYTTHGWRYLEAAPTDSPEHSWGTKPFTVPGADGTAIGTGQQNTIDITNEDSFADKAADECANLIVPNNGLDYADWFLPSKDELKVMFDNLYVHGVGYLVGYSYWSSSEASENNAWGYIPSDDTSLAGIKISPTIVRAIRSF